MAAAIYAIEDFQVLRDRRPRAQMRCYCDAGETGQHALNREIQEIRRAFPNAAIQNFDQSVGSLNTGTRHDVIYSLDLLQGLPDVAARVFLKAAFECLRPGGRLIFANVCLKPNVAFCDRCITQTRNYRNEFEMAELTRNIPEGAIQGQIVYRDSAGLNVLLEVQKQGAVNEMHCSPRRWLNVQSYN